MPKTSAVPQDNEAIISATDSVVGVQAGIPQTVRFLLSQLATFFWTLANIPTGATSPITRDSESQFPFVASGGVWSGDSYASTRNASMTALICYINGRRISVAAVTARTFTASKDTYIDILDNGDGTGTLVYTEATNNAASPLLAANSIRIGIIITGATTIAAATSVNQGQETMLLPIATSTPYAVCDSLGNLICPRDPNRRIIGQRQLVSSATGSPATITQIAGLSIPIIIPTGGRKVRIIASAESITDATGGRTIDTSVWDGTVGSGTQLRKSQQLIATGSSGYLYSLITPALTLSAGSHTINPGWTDNASGALTMAAGATSPASFTVELV